MNRIAQTLLSLIAFVATTGTAAELKYSVTPDFFEQNPDYQSLGPCHGGVVLNKAGDIYVTTDTKRGMVIYSAAGKFLRAVGPTRIHGLEVREENGTEYLYCARPSDHEVVKPLDGDRCGRFTFRRRLASIRTRRIQPLRRHRRTRWFDLVADGYGRTTC
jgi:hypothetical protein